MSGQSRTSRGLSAYARIRRFRPMFGFITIFEALLSLLGVTVLILWLMSGSFENAGQALDHFVDQFSSLIRHFLAFIR